MFLLRYEVIIQWVIDTFEKVGLYCRLKIIRGIKIGKVFFDVVNWQLIQSVPGIVAKSHASITIFQDSNIVILA